MGKRLQLRLLSDALTGEWREGEAGEGRGSPPREPGGLRHQAGGVSSRAPHYDPVGRISPGPTRWPPGAERHLVPKTSNLKHQTCKFILTSHNDLLGRQPTPTSGWISTMHTQYPRSTGRQRVWAAKPEMFKP